MVDANAREPYVSENNLARIGTIVVCCLSAARVLTSTLQ